MTHNQSFRSPKSVQRGITLFEALIALLILALGVLGLAVVQARMLVETRTTNSRATAIRLIADLNDRIRLNASAPLINGNSPYADQANQAFQAETEPATDCSATMTSTTATPCTAAQQAAYDRWAWKREVANSLMNGVASITQSTGSPQLQVVVAWRLNENTNITLNGSANTVLASELQVTDTATTANNICNPGNNAGNNNFICHIDFIVIN